VDCESRNTIASMFAEARACPGVRIISESATHRRYSEIKHEVQEGVRAKY